MKKYILAASLLFSIIGCSDDYYDSINIDQTNPSTVPASFLITHATTSLFHQMGNTNVNLNVFRMFAQYFTTTTYTQEPNYDLNTRNIPGQHWNRLYTRVLYSLQDAKQKVEDDTNLLPAEKNNQLAMIEIMEVYTWQVLVDTFGNIPYSDALKGLDNQFPTYDKAAVIYEDLIARAQHAISLIDTNVDGLDEDIIFGGNMSLWKKTGGSLLLRLGVQLSDVNQSLASSAINSAMQAGVISSNNENFQMNHLSSSPYTNPLYEDLVLSGRTDFLPANTIVDYMNDLNDPRRALYFDDLGTGTYSGGTYGAPNSYLAYSHLGTLLFTATTPSCLIDYAEVEFLLAEAAEKGYNVGGSVEHHYNAGIKASMEYWGVDPDDIETYLASPDVAFNTAQGNTKQKIAKQFWLAMYNRGFEGWNVWRRLDAPTLNVAAQSGSPVPTRYTYPESESSINSEAYSQAVSDMGGDTQTIKLFWDVN